jgi:hypothetical protein
VLTSQVGGVPGRAGGCGEGGGSVYARAGESHAGGNRQADGTAAETVPQHPAYGPQRGEARHQSAGSHPVRGSRGGSADPALHLRLPTHQVARRILGPRVPNTIILTALCVSMLLFLCLPSYACLSPRLSDSMCPRTGGPWSWSHAPSSSCYQRTRSK